MKKRLLAIALCLVMALSLLPFQAMADYDDPVVALDAEHFPDDEFRNLVQGNYDRNWDGVLSEGEINDAVELIANDRYFNSVAGIEYLTALQTISLNSSLDCDMDLSANTALKSLSCSNAMGMRELSLPSGLESLTCSATGLLRLDLSALPSLTYLDCKECEGLRELDLPGSLEYLDCYLCPVGSLPSMPNLTHLDCRNCDIMGMGFLSESPNLEFLDCSDNELDSLDLSDLPRLTHLEVSACGLTELDLSEHTALTYLNCGYNPLGFLPLEGLDRLETLSCNSCGLDSVDLSSLSNLKRLEIADNRLGTLDVSQNGSLQTLSAAGNGLWYVQFGPNGPARPLSELSLQWNYLPTLDLRGTDFATLVEQVEPLTLDGGCLMRQAGGYTLITDPATTLIVNDEPVITTQPSQEIWVSDGNAFSIYVGAVGGDDLEYQWQYADSPTAWFDIGENYVGWDDSLVSNGNATPILNLRAHKSMDGTNYRCRLTGAGATVYSSATLLHVLYPPHITTQPADHTFFKTGQTVVLTVEAEGDQLTYQWLYQPLEEEELWFPCTGPGYNTPSLTLTGSEDIDGYMYRCKVSNPVCMEESECAVVELMDPPLITLQPQDVTTAPGTEVTFSIAAYGKVDSYQWEFRTDASGSWANATMSGADTHAITVEATEEQNGYQFRCTVTNQAGTEVSDPATLTVTKKPVITEQPVSTLAFLGDTVEFTVTAIGDGLSYQWQSRINSSGAWGDSDLTGNKTDTLTVPVTAIRNGAQFRCVVTNSFGSTQSDAATLSLTNVPTNSWKQINGKWYYFDGNGVAVTGWKQISGKWYYFNASAEMVTGWQKISNKWYYFSSSGAMVTGWQTISGKKYYFETGGAMVTGLKKIDGKWYYFESGGALYATEGWREIGGKKYYFDSTGAAATGWKQIGGKWYYFNTSAQMVTGWQTVSGKKYYFGTSGVMTTGWKQIDGKWYYFASSGALSTGWLTISGKKYYFDADGVMVTGVQQIDGKWYYFESSGAMYATAGWFESSGAMYATAGWKQISGKWYYFDSAGVAKVGWLKDSGKWYYFNASAQMVTGWQKISNKWYWFESSGVMFANGDKTINGKTYHFDANGVCTNP